MKQIIPGTTKPRPSFSKSRPGNPAELAAGRYGTPETCAILGAEKTFQDLLHVQAVASKTLSRLHPDIVPESEAHTIEGVANLQHVNPHRIRTIEDRTGHDIIAVNTALSEQLPENARPYVNKFRTSADTTESARALQWRAALETIAVSVENLRDVLVEKAVRWMEAPFMDVTHGYYALPAYAGRPLAHYAEMLQSGLDVMKFFASHSIRGKWGDATGNHHAAYFSGIDGMLLQEEYCKDLGVGHMTAPAQIPGLEFQADLVYSLARIGETMNNMARFLAWGRSSDVMVFVNKKPKKAKGSSAMPHKDIYNGNPTAEEQVMSIANFLRGNMMSALCNCQMTYGRDLSASSNTRIIMEDGIKYFDHGIRRLAGITYWMGLNEDKSRQRVLVNKGLETSPAVMTYLTDSRFVEHPLPWTQAHDLMGCVAARVWNSGNTFLDELLKERDVTDRIPAQDLERISNPLLYVGQSQEIIESVAQQVYQERTF